MNITKDQFVEIINAVIAQQERDEQIGNALDEVAKDGDNRSLVFSTPLVESIIKALDYDETISWWFWDGPRHGERAEDYAIYLGEDADMRKFVIKDAEDLYDFLEMVK